MVGPAGSLLQECEAVAAFKQQLGIHPTEDAEFGWIAEVGLQSPLPPRWTSHTDTGSGYVYYIDHDRQASSWENPLVPFLRRIVEIGRLYLMQPTEQFFEDQKGDLWHQHKQALDGWHGPFTDDGGRQYFVNSSEGVSSWQDPRVDAQYIFELESGLLTSLEEVLPAPRPETPGWGLGGETLEGQSWRTSDGADVLTLDGGGLHRPKTLESLQRTYTRKAQAQKTAKEEHKSTLQKMSGTAERLHGLQQDDEEAQRMMFTRKVEERRRRRVQERAAPPPPAGGIAAPCAARIPQLPPVPGGGVGAAEAEDPGVGPPASASALRPLRVPNPLLELATTVEAPPLPMPLAPPPPLQEAEEAVLEELPPSISPGGASLGEAVTEAFRPPQQPPSPHTGMVPVMTPDVERRLGLVGGGKEQVYLGSDLGSLELNRAGPEAEAAAPELCEAP